MKFLISLALMLFVAFSMFASFDAAACGCKKHHHHHYKKHHRYSSGCYRRMYVDGTCESRYDCNCGRYTVCHPGRYVFCRTEVSYHHGRNSGSLEVCY